MLKMSPVLPMISGGLGHSVELIMELEEAFEIEIPDEDAEKLTTVQAVVDYIAKKVLKQRHNSRYKIAKNKSSSRKRSGARSHNVILDLRPFDHMSTG
jgi:hypothetical protein